MKPFRLDAGAALHRRSLCIAAGAALLTPLVLRAQPAPPASAPAPGEPIPRAAGSDTIATVRQRGVLRVGIVPVAPMVIRKASGKTVGYSIDLAKRLAEDLGVQLEFVATDWAGVIPDLVERRSDVILTGLWLSVPRALIVNFSDPTASEEVHLFASRRAAGTYRSLADYNQRRVRIAVAADPLQQRVAQAQFPNAERMTVEDDPLRVVEQGRADAAVLATLSAAAVEAASAGRIRVVSATPLSRTSVAMAVRKGDPDTLAFLNTWLALQRDQGWLDERARYWATARDAAE